MFDRLARLLIGAACQMDQLVPDIGALGCPGRPPDWDRRSAEKCRSNNAQAAFVEPFFNHDDGDTRRQNAA